MEKTEFYCRECWRYLRSADEWRGDVIEWIVCDRCLERLAGRGRIVGTQPAVCQRCREPFEATRQAHKFCSSACRARAWRERQRIAAQPTGRLRSR
jgi:hypothetical protein